MKSPTCYSWSSPVLLGLPKGCPSPKKNIKDPQHGQSEAIEGGVPVGAFTGSQGSLIVVDSFGIHSSGYQKMISSEKIIPLMFRSLFRRIELNHRIDTTSEGVSHVID